MTNDWNRRDFLSVTTGTLAGVSLAAYAHSSDDLPTSCKEPATMPAEFPVKAISSHNGLEATKLAYQQMLQGADTLDAAIAGVGINEANDDDTSVGYGGLPNEAGVVELDAAVMHGPTHQAGGVGAIQNIKHPAQVAKLVMSRSDHVLLVGDGALAFAKAHGFKEENLLSERARKIWLYWKETLSTRDDWLAPPEEEVDDEVAEFFKLKRKKQPKIEDEQAAGHEHTERTWERPTGTIHLAAMNAKGELSCTTTTSGLAFKIPGRVGDSPIVGAGLFVDQEVGSCGSTGRGEANLENLSSAVGVELMRQGMSPKDAGLEVLKRIAKRTSPRLRNEKGHPEFGIKFYLMNKDGEHAGVSMWSHANFAITDAKGTRLEPCAYLYDKRKDR